MSAMEIKFRGMIAQGLENAGHWVYWGIGGTDMLDALDHDTVGQIIGLFDKNGVEAWAGDIVKIPNKGNYEVIFKEGCFGFKGKISDIVYHSQFEWESHEIIGNKYANPELLEG